MQRRNFLGGLAGIFAAAAAPAIIHDAMKIVVPKQDIALPIQIGLGNVDNFYHRMLENIGDEWAEVSRHPQLDRPLSAFIDEQITKRRQVKQELRVLRNDDTLAYLQVQHPGGGAEWYFPGHPRADRRLHA